MYFYYVELRLLTRYLINTHFDKTSTFDKWVLCFMEIWKDIPNYEGYYQISNMGNIKSLSRTVFKNGLHPYKCKEKKLKLINHKSGYLFVNLSAHSKRKTIRVHELMAITFLNHIPNGHVLVVDHVNAVKTDNRIENLQLISQRENLSKDIRGASSKYTGVGRNANVNKNKWTSRIRINGRLKYLGNFEKEIDAYNAYIQKLKEIN